MTKKFSTRKALIASLLTFALCFAMLVGTTFAWFTDSATSANNTIKTGNLDVEMYWADGTQAVPAVDSEGWINASTTAIFDYDNWEPGYVQVRHIKIANNGSLALKYKVLIVADGEVSELADVIDVYYADPAVQVADRTALNEGNKLCTLSEALAGLDVSGNGTLEAYTADTITIALKMQETAGNEYKNLEIGSSFTIKVLATQTTSESDSFGTDYDADAEYVEPVSNATELAAALGNGKNVVLENDIAVTEVITVNGDVVIDMNGKTFDASGMTGANLGRPFQLSDGANLTVNAVGADIKLGGHGFINVLSTAKNVNITVNGGNFSGETQNGAFIRLRNGNENVNIVLNDVNYNDASNEGYIVSTQGFEYTGEGTLVVNGGSYAANYGFQIYALNATLTNVEINTNGTAVEASGNDTYGFANVTVENCDITVAPGVQVVNAPAAGVAASHGGSLTVKNSTITGNMGAVYHIYNTGGSINAVSNYIEGASYTKGIYKNDAAANGSIVIDGVTVA